MLSNFEKRAEFSLKLSIVKKTEFKTQNLASCGIYYFKPELKHYRISSSLRNKKKKTTNFKSTKS